MTSIESLTIEVADPAAAEQLLRRRLRAGHAVALRVRSGANGRLPRVHAVAHGVAARRRQGPGRRALNAGATALKPVAKSLWGYGGVVQAPDGTIWKVATSAKKDKGPATRQIDQIVLLLGAADVAASKRVYTDRGLSVAKSFGGKYVEFAARPAPSSWGSTGAAPWPRTPAWHRTAPGRTGSRSAATPAPSPTRTGSNGKPSRDKHGGAVEAACRETGQGAVARSSGYSRSSGQNTSAFIAACPATGSSVSAAHGIYPHRVSIGDRGSKTAQCAVFDPRSRRAPIPGAVLYPNGGNVRRVSCPGRHLAAFDPQS